MTEAFVNMSIIRLVEIFNENWYLGASYNRAHSGYVLGQWEKALNTQNDPWIIITCNNYLVKSTPKSTGRPICIKYQRVTVQTAIYISTPPECNIYSSVHTWWEERKGYQWPKGKHLPLICVSILVWRDSHIMESSKYGNCSIFSDNCSECKRSCLFHLYELFTISTKCSKGNVISRYYLGW